MRLAILGSGSRGNSLVLDSGGRRILVDAGFSCRELERRLRLVGVEPETLEALVLTHEHSDHVRGAELFARRHRLPVWATAGTLDSGALGEETRRAAHRLVSGLLAEVAGFVVEPFAVPHDAAEPVGFAVADAAGRRLGLAADLGIRSRLAWGRLAELDVLVLETNHDLGMLRAGPYPWSLKQRIAGSHGHLSNEDAAGGLPELVCDRLRWVVLYHLSQTNNSPVLAADAVGETLAREGSQAAVALTEQGRPTEWLEVG
ncbi:MAG TPA: MBL fold metallo-hydrolase [Thermoanaerobaculia bacterium]|nr:MBL fold metallo-hydrolase [Thermoanaerobaculia bacterium]